MLLTVFHFLNFDFFALQISIFLKKLNSLIKKLAQIALRLKKNRLKKYHDKQTNQQKYVKSKASCD